MDSLSYTLLYIAWGLDIETVEHLPITSIHVKVGCEPYMYEGDLSLDLAMLGRLKKASCRNLTARGTYLYQQSPAHHPRWTLMDTEPVQIDVF